MKRCYVVAMLGLFLLSTGCSTTMKTSRDSSGAKSSARSGAASTSVLGRVELSTNITRGAVATISVPSLLTNQPGSALSKLPQPTGATVSVIAPRVAVTAAPAAAAASAPTTSSVITAMAPSQVGTTNYAPSVAPRPSAPSAPTSTTQRSEPAASAAAAQDSGLRSPRVVLQFRDTLEAERFLAVVRVQSATEEQCRVLDALISEKQRQLDSAESELQWRFGISSATNYHFDVRSLTIFIVDPSTGERRPHRQLRTSEEEEAFLRILFLKRNATEQTAALRSIREEKQAELNRAWNLLERDYGLTRTRRYRYDERTMSLLE